MAGSRDTLCNSGDFRSEKPGLARGAPLSMEPEKRDKTHPVSNYLILEVLAQNSQGMGGASGSMLKTEHIKSPLPETEDSVQQKVYPSSGAKEKEKRKTGTSHVNCSS